MITVLSIIRRDLVTSGISGQAEAGIIEELSGGYLVWILIQ